MLNAKSIGCCRLTRGGFVTMGFINQINTLLISALQNSNEENVSYILSFLGYSENVRYERILKSYLNHSNKEVRGAALEALQQLDYTNKQVNRKGD